jgi:NADH dehydrogenase subunit B (EC 1.6.5.3)
MMVHNKIKGKPGPYVEPVKVDLAQFLPPPPKPPAKPAPQQAQQAPAA